MKKLSEIKTGEKFEHDGRFYMGMVACDFDESDYPIEVTLPIDLETGRSDSIIDPDVMVTPLSWERLKIIIQGDAEINGMMLYSKDDLE